MLFVNYSVSYPPNKLYTESFEQIIQYYNLNSNNNYALPFQMNIIPIHLFYKPDHEFELYNTNICKGHLEIYEKQKTRDEIKKFREKILSRFPDVFEYLEGTKDKKILYDYWSLYKYADTYLVDDIDKRNFNFLKDKFNFTQEDFEMLKNYSKEFLLMDYSDTNFPKSHPEITIMVLSYTMHSLINWMEKAKIGNKQNNTYIKYVVYSAHDASIGALEYFMEYAFNISGEFAELADSRFFEFYLDDDNNYRIRYIKGNSLIPKLDITFDYFKNVINEITWSDEKVAEFCKFNDENEYKENNNKKIPILFISMIFLAIINGILLLILIILILKK